MSTVRQPFTSCCRRAVESYANGEKKLKLRLHDTSQKSASSSKGCQSSSIRVPSKTSTKNKNVRFRHHQKANAATNQNDKTMRSLVASAYFSFLVYLFVILPLFATLQQPEAQQQQQSNDVGAYFRHKTVIIPHDSKKHRGGEDAASSSDTVLVVADGVGGWARHNVNPGLYSRLLTQTVVELATATPPAGDDANGKNSSLIEVVHKANWIAAEKHLGSATCTTLQITGPTTMSTLNIGDSGYSIHRVVDGSQSSDNGSTPEADDDEKSQGNIWNKLTRRFGRQNAVKKNNVQYERGIELIYASEPGQKSFNYPHQLGGQYGDEVADVAVSETHEMENGDIIVVYSDGVSDNVDPQEFHTCLTTYLKDDQKAVTDDDDDESVKNAKAEEAFVSYSLVADCIARTAYELGKNDKFDSPFAKGARAAGWGDDYTGGKHDDISVIVSQFFVGSPTASASSRREEEDDEDPHYTESIYIYTGPVPPLSELPTKPLQAIKTEL